MKELGYGLAQDGLFPGRSSGFFPGRFTERSQRSCFLGILGSRSVEKQSRLQGSDGNLYGYVFPCLG